MKSLHWVPALCAAAVLTFHAHPAAAAKPSCDGQAHCYETTKFTAAITDFRNSVSGNNRLATVTVRFSNKTDGPLTLGYVHNSGVIIDDQGNRYTVDSRDSNNVRAIGVIDNRHFDPKFTLQPGESSDARFQFSFYAANKIVGTTYQVDLTVREIDPIAGNQFKLGREHALQYQGLADSVLGAQNTAAPAAAQPGSADAAAAVAIVDPCESIPRCYNAGPFTAQIEQLTTSTQNNNHLVRVNIKFRNNSSEPLVLAYTRNSGTMIDNYGNRYTIDGRYAERVKGIGQVERDKADPQFVLRPGEARNASFEYSRYIGKTAVGTVFTPDLAIEQLEILPSKQIRSVREYSLTFADLTATAPAILPAQPATLEEAVQGLKDLFKKKK